MFKKLAIFIIIAIIAVAGFYFYKKSQTPQEEKQLTLSEAAKVGTPVTHELLVQIQRPKGNPEDIKGRYERGDVVRAVPGGFEWSPAERDGFMILKMNLTPKQAEALMRPMEEMTGEKSELGEPIKSTLKRRRYAVDLAKIGIADDDEKGKSAEGKVWEWEVLYEK